MSGLQNCDLRLQIGLVSFQDSASHLFYNHQSAVIDPPTAHPPGDRAGVRLWGQNIDIARNERKLSFVTRRRSHNNLTTDQSTL